MKKFYEENANNNPPKEYDYIDELLLSIAREDAVVYNSEEKPILGANNITIGVGIIICNGDKEYAVSHITTDFEISIYSILNNISSAKPIRIIIIPGSNIMADKVQTLITFLRNKNNVTLYDFDVEVLNLKHFANEAGSIDFAFDTRTEELLKPDHKSIISSRRS